VETGAAAGDRCPRRLIRGAALGDDQLRRHRAARRHLRRDYDQRPGWKIPGRTGDSPILGAGLYVDNEVGAAGSTGRGEANLYNLSSFLIVEAMRRGMSPKDAGMEALKRIKASTIEKRLLNSKGDPNFNIRFFVLNKRGEYAGVAMYHAGETKYACLYRKRRTDAGARAVALRLAQPIASRSQRRCWRRRGRIAASAQTAPREIGSTRMNHAGSEWRYGTVPSDLRCRLSSDGKSPARAALRAASPPIRSDSRGDATSSASWAPP
jgi:hypothetical protein